MNIKCGNIWVYDILSAMKMTQNIIVVTIKNAFNDDSMTNGGNFLFQLKSSFWAAKDFNEMKR